MSDYLAGLLAARKKPPTGRVHLHAFVRRRSLSRMAVYKDGEAMPLRYTRTGYRGFEPPARTELDGELDWRVSTRASSVCKIPGRCVLADIVEEK